MFLAFCAVAPTALIVMGIERTNSVVAAILINSNALMVALLAPLLISEAMTYQKYWGLASAFLTLFSSCSTETILSFTLMAYIFWEH